MKPLSYLTTAVLLFAIMPFAAGAQTKTRNFTWLIWEQRTIDPRLCQSKGLCTPQRKYITRLIEEPSEQKAREMLGAIDQLAKLRGQPAEHPEAPKMCRQTEAGKIIGFNPETWDMSDKLTGLKGLKGVYFSVQGLKKPDGYRGAFRRPSKKHPNETEYDAIMRVVDKFLEDYKRANTDKS